MTETSRKEKSPMEHVKEFMCKHKRMNPLLDPPTVANTPTPGTSKQSDKAPALVSDIRVKDVRTKKAAAHTASKKGNDQLALVHPAIRVETIRDNTGTQVGRDTPPYNAALQQRNRSQQTPTSGTATTAKGSAKAKEPLCCQHHHATATSTEVSPTPGLHSRH